MRISKVLLLAQILFGLGFLACGASAQVPGWTAPPKEAWTTRTIYQVLTDRFWPESTKDTGTGCKNGLNSYCGGVWKGTTAKLDYIKVR